MRLLTGNRPSCLRLALLLATAAAFLLVPAAQAVANGVLKVNLAGSGEGEVFSVPPNEGEPPIECHWDGEKLDIGTGPPGPGGESGVPGLEECENQMVEQEGNWIENLEAKAGEGSKFTGWTVNKGLPVSCETGKFCIIAALGGTDAELTATFEAVNVLTIAGAGTGNGTVDWEYGSEEGTCTIAEGTPSGECEPEPGEFETLTTTFTPAAGSEFSGSSFAGEGTSNCSGTKDPCSTTFFGSGEEGTLTVTFEKQPPNVINLAGAGTGSGTVTSAGSTTIGEQFNCHITAGVLDEEAGEVCKIEVTESTPPEDYTLVTFTPDASSEYIECSWAGEGFSDCSENPKNNPAGVIFFGTGEEGTLTVTFEPVYTLTVEKTGSGDGTVSSSPSGINCAPGCTEDAADFLSGEVVTLTGTPDGSSDPVVWESCPGTVTGENKCEVTMDEAKEAVANFDLETFTLTVEAFGNGEVTAPGIACTEVDNGEPACEEDFAYGTNVEVTATPDALNSIGSLTGSGSANEECGTAGPEEAATCEFAIEEDSGVSAEFVAAESIESKSGNVHGFTPQNTTLEFTEDGEGNTCADVDLGIFLANAQEDVTYAKTCGLIVTATGAENVLSAEDESETSTGHLVNSGYELTQPLETQAEGLPGLLFPGEGGGTLASLESVVDLLTYGGPVNSDNVTLEFSQLIKEHDPLYTGEYSKQITLTLEQTAL